MKVSHLHSSCQRLTAHVDPGSTDPVQDHFPFLPLDVAKVPFILLHSILPYFGISFPVVMVLGLLSGV